MDAARSAVRLGAHEVRVIYRRTRVEMPAIAEEVEEALAEGVEVLELVAPVSLQQDQGGPTLVCRRMSLGEPDESGRRRPLPLVWRRFPRYFALRSAPSGSGTVARHVGAP